VTDYVKLCPACHTERPLHEDVCAGVKADGSPCNFVLMDVMPAPASAAKPQATPGLAEETQTGYEAGTPSGDAASTAPEPAVPTETGAPTADAAADGTCRSCHAAVEPGDAACLSCGADLGATAEAPKPQRRIGEWIVVAGLPAATPDAELFLARRTEGESVALLRLLAAGIAPEAGVYAVLAGLDHPGIPHLIAHGRQDDRVFEVWEHIDGPTLAEVAPALAADPNVLEHAVGALIGALTLFERRGLRHGNLQPSSIRARSLSPPALAITDYTTASIAEFDVQARGARTLNRYMAPEAIADASSAASDWWSLGIILLELISQGRCFAGVHDRAFLLHLVSRGVAIPEDIPPRWRNLLEGLLTRDHAKRWKSEKALQWLTSDEPIPTDYDGTGGPRPQGEAFAFGGQSFTSPADLALYAAQDPHWGEALADLESGRLATWLATFDKNAKKGQGYDLVSRIGSDTRIAADIRLALALAAMNRDMPLCVRGAILTPSALLADVPAAANWLSAPVLSHVRRMKRPRDQWLLHLAERSDRVRARAREARLELHEEEFAVLRLVTAPAALEARWAKQRAIFPDSSHAAVASLIERRLPSDEDLLLLLSLKHHHFKPLAEVLREAQALAAGRMDETAPVPEFDAEAAKAWLVRPRRDLVDELNARIPGFERCKRPKVDEWVDSYRSANRRMPLARLLVTLAVPAEAWQEPPETEYIRNVLGHMHRRVLAGIQKGSLVQMRASSSNLDLSALPAEIHGPLLDAIVSRSDQEHKLAGRSTTTATFFANVRELDRKARNFNRDTGMEALYAGFPFLTLLDRTEDGDRTRMAPLLLWPVKLSVAAGATGAITLACDLTRAVAINPALETILGTVEFERWSEVIAGAIADSFDSRGSVLRALGDLVESAGELSDEIGAMPRASSVKRVNVPEIRSAAALFLAEFPSQAIANDLKGLQAKPLDGTALHCLLRLGQHEKHQRPDRIPQAERFGTLEADPSQEDAVARSRFEPGLVVQGPPGTGKSQTIVNMITDCLGRGESVIVICEKKAALDVVQKRLEAERLGNRVVRVENTTVDRTALLNALREQVPAILNDAVDHASTARQRRLPLAGKIDALEAELDAHHEAIHATDPRLQMSHREVLSLIAKENLAARGLSAPQLRAVLGPLAQTELETVISACAGLVDVWLAGGVPGGALAVLKPFATDSAQAEGIGALLRGYFDAETKRADSLAALRALPQRYRTLTSPDNEALGRWLELHGREIDAMAAPSLRRCAAWRPYFSASGALREEGAEAKAALSELIASLDAMAMTGPAGIAHEAVSLWPEVDISALAAALPVLKKQPSLFAFLDLPAVLKKRSVRRLLDAHGAASERLSAIAHAEAACFERAVRKSAAQLDGIAARLTERACVRSVTRGALLSSAHTLALEIAAFERFAGMVDACPVPDVWLHVQAAAQAADAAAPLAPLVTALEIALLVADARAASRRALDALRPYLTDAAREREDAALASDARSGLDQGAIIAALPALVPFQTFRLRYAEQPQPARASFDALQPLAADLAGDPERSARAKIEALMRREAATAWKAEIETRRPHLQRLQSEIMKDIGELETLDTKIRDANRRLLATVDRGKIGAQTAWAPAWAGGSASKKLRQVFQIGRQLGLLHLKPVWLVNPDVASRMLPLEPGLFDVAIFDEASQMRVVNALPGLFRAKRCVVSGDEKQLPPTTFFGTRADAAGDDGDDAADSPTVDDDIAGAEADEDAEAAPRLDPRALQIAERHIKDCEDLLALSRGLLPESSLDIHYRSEYRELIAFSNAAYYAGRLNVPIRKSPAEVQRARPIEVIRVDGEYKAQTNAAEADRIVEVLAELWAKEETPPTVGVVTFNMKQAELIGNKLDARADKDRAFSKAYTRERTRKAQGEDVGFFVKNLENVQGDERDWIVFSTTFGRDGDGVFKRAFGALNQQGGERRLNVAVTRAKRKNLIVTSMPVAEISDVLGSGRPPVRARDYLQLYLKYAELVSDGHLDDAAKLLEMFGPQDRGAGPLVQTEPDDLIAQALDTLLADGFSAAVLPREDAFSLDIAVSDPGSARFVLGVEIDSPRHSLLRSARAREVWRPKLLARSGLKLHRIASAEWVRNPQAERARLIAAARQALEGADA